MAKCTKCSVELPADAAFCPGCSTPVTRPGTPKPPRSETGTISDIKTFTPDDVVDTSSDLEEGSEFHSRYIIERKLGSGAMGVVYVASDKVTSRKVALKLINAALVNSPSARQRFVREGLIARDIRHPNIINMYDVGEFEGQVYLSMEYLAGETLREWMHGPIQAGEDIPFDAAKTIVRNILDGLAAAHALGIIHRDLKPENIMMTGNAQAGDYRLKILDFGIARAVGEKAGKQLVTTSSSTGTPLYMAPEQKTAADTVGPPADLYAVSAIFYELLMGVAPAGHWAPPSRERKELPSGIDAVLEKGLSMRPRSRYQTAQEYVTALADVSIKREPEPAPEPAPIPKPPPPPPDPSPEPRKQGWLPQWAYWNSLSKKQRRVFWLVFAVLFILLGLYQNWLDSNGRFPQTPVSSIDPIEPAVVPPAAVQTPPQVQTPPPKRETQEPPPPPQPRDISGRWFDEFEDSREAIALVQINQNGNSVSGRIYDTRNIQLGTFSGQMNGSTLRYEWSYFGGLRGSGHGELQPDGQHIDIEVMGPGGTEDHTLHRNHLPSQ